MAETLTSDLNLELAWRRVKNDYNKQRVFVQHPFERQIIEADAEKWLKFLQEDLNSDRYTPKSMGIIEIPKSGHTIRPGGELRITDQVVYAACVSACFENIRNTLNNSRKIDFSHPLADDIHDADWVKNSIDAYNNYRTESLTKLSNSKFVLFTDITSYYENIDIGILTSDLNYINCSSPVVNRLSKCLKKWAPSNRGIPQGFSASDILGKLYLNTIDEALFDLGYNHVRWVDDIRIFCRDEIEARKALLDLTSLLRKRGLHLQSAKTNIAAKEAAREIISGIAPVLFEVREKFIEVIKTVTGLDVINYLPQAENILYQSSHDTPIEVIREAYDEFFIKNKYQRFDKTLFRFLINRLRQQKDDFALKHSLTLLEKYPEETHTIMDYLQSIEMLYKPHIQIFLCNFMKSKEAIYSYQIYQIVEALNKNVFNPSQEIISLMRQYSFDNNTPSYLRAVCRQFLGIYGSKSDLERFEAYYARASNEIEACEIICCLHRMEKSRRNAFLSRVESESEFHRRAVLLVKNDRL